MSTLEAETSAPPAAGQLLPTRLHRATLWLPCVEMLVRIALPLMFAAFVFGPVSVATLAVVFALAPVWVYHAVRHFTLRFELSAGELVIHSGLVFRRERRIPLGRVQEIEIHQSFLQRLFKLARLQITTAGSDAQEASLAMLARQQADTLRQTIIAWQMATDRQATPVTADDPPEYVCRLGLRDLVLGGLTSRLVATLTAVVGVVVYFQWIVDLGSNWFAGVEEKVDGRLERRMPGQGVRRLLESIEDRVPDTGLLGSIADFVFNDTLAKGVSLAMLGLAAASAAYVIRYHRFRLTRRGDLLSTSHGLLTFRSGSLARDRVQALKLEEGLLRRWFGLAAVRVDSAGDRGKIDEQKHRDVLLPVARLETAREVARQVIPGLAAFEPPWRRISRRAIMRGCRKGWLLWLAVAMLTYLVAGWYCLVWLPGVPLIYLLNYQWYRHTGYWLSEHHFLHRQGWLNRDTLCLPVRNVQNVIVRQSYFDRRKHLATLLIDTAGQSNTGGGPVIRHLPLADACAIQQSLVAIAAE